MVLEASQLDMPKLEIDKEALDLTLSQARLKHSQQQQQVIQFQAQMGSVSAQMVSLGRSVERIQEQRGQWRDKQAQLQALQTAREPTEEGVQGSLLEQLNVALVLRLDEEACMERQRNDIAALELLIRQLEQQQLKQEHEIQNTDSKMQEHFHFLRR